MTFAPVDCHLVDLVDLSLVQQMADAHYRAAGMPLGIIDALDGSILVGAGWQDICATFHRANPVARRRCEESDTYIKGHIKAGKTCAYKCANGLWDIGIPIIVAGRHLATMFLGQFFYEGESPDRKFFEKQARRFHFPAKEYLAALDRVPVLTRTKVDYILAYNRALCGSIADIAERSLGKLAKDRELRFVNTLLKAQQEKSPNGLLVVDDKQRMISFNQRFVDMWKIPPAVMASELNEKALRSVCRLLPAADKYRALVAGVYRHRRRESLHEIPLNDGRVFEQFSAPLFGPEGAYYGRFWNFRDITARKRAEEVLTRDKDTLEKLVRESAQQLAEAQIKVAQSKRLSDIGMLASTIAHEIRNPLAAINAAVYNIRRKARSARIAPHLATIDRKVEESSLIIQNLLSFAFVREPHYERMALLPLIDECLKTIRSKYADSATVVDRKIGFTGGTRIEADRMHLQILFLNILDNAFQALEGAAGSVILEGKCARGRAEIRISDTGTGIAKDDLPKIFEPFFSRKIHGTGLGLTVSRLVVERHGGTIEIAAGKGAGTTVLISLPLKKVAGAMSAGPKDILISLC
jgi:signal transduction histidine kinase